MSELASLMTGSALADKFPPIQLYITLAMTLALFGVIANKSMEKSSVFANKPVGKAGYAVIFLAFIAAISVVFSSAATAAQDTTSCPEFIYLVLNAIVILGLFWVMVVWWWCNNVTAGWSLPPTPS